MSVLKRRFRLDESWSHYGGGWVQEDGPRRSDQIGDWLYFVYWLGGGYGDPPTIGSAWKCFARCAPSLRFWSADYHRVHFWQHWEHVELRLFAYPARSLDIDDVRGLAFRVEDRRWRHPTIDRDL